MKGWEKLLVRLEQNDPTIPELDLTVGETKEKQKDSLISGNKGIEDTGLEKLCHSLKHNLTLEVLNLTKNKITPVGAQFLAQLLASNTHLKTLSLHANSLGSEGCISICEAIKNNKGTIMEVLILGGDNQIGSQGLLAVASLIENCQTLKEISLVSEIKTENLPELEKLADSITKNKNIRSINFSYCPFSDPGVEILTKKLFLSKSNKIKVLELVGCQIGDTGATHLMNCINDSRNHIKLEKLSVSFNPISSLVKTHLTQALEERQKLKDVKKKSSSSSSRERSGTGSTSSSSRERSGTGSSSGSGKKEKKKTKK